MIEFKEITNTALIPAIISALQEYLPRTISPMLVGTQQDPRYFGGVPYTTPLIDVDQYNGILRAIDDTLEKRIFHWKAGLINENA